MEDLKNIDWAEQEKRVDAYEEAEKQRQAEERIKKAIPEELQNETFENYKQNKPKQQAFWKQMKAASDCITTGGFITVCLLGGYGIGKTHLSVAVMREVLSATKTEIYTFTSNRKLVTEKYEKPFSARYELADRIREKYEAARSFSEKIKQEDVITSYSNCDLLVLDEIGRTTSANVEKEIIYKIMNARDSNHKSTILISNMTFDEFANHIGGATMDRLKNSAIFPFLSGMDSMRGTK